MSSQLRSWNLFEFLTFFLPALFVSYLQIQQTKKHVKLHNFCKAISSQYSKSQGKGGLRLRPAVFQTRPETYETETRLET